MSIDVSLLINLLALFHRNTALPARISSPGRAPRPSYVIPKPRLPKLHSCFPTDPDSICLPSSVLTVPLGLLYSAVVPKGAFSIRDQHKPPNPLVSTLGSNWRGAQARWLNANQQAEASSQAPILSTVLHSNVSPGVHPHRDQPSCHKPRLDKMVSAGAPHWRGAQAQWLFKCGSGCRLLLLILITPPDVSPGVHPHRDQPSCHKSRLDKMVSAGAPHWRGAQAQWLYKCGSGCRLLLLILITPSDVSLGVHPHRDPALLSQTPSRQDGLRRRSSVARYS